MISFWSANWLQQEQQRIAVGPENGGNLFVVAMQLAASVAVSADAVAAAAAAGAAAAVVLLYSQFGALKLIIVN